MKRTRIPTNAVRTTMMMMFLLVGIIPDVTSESNDNWSQQRWCQKKAIPKHDDDPLPPSPIVQFFHQRQCRHRSQDDDDDMECWVYTGTVSDILHGHVIAHVQGLEVVSPIVADTSRSVQQFQRRCPPFLGQMIHEQQPYYSCQTFFSRKLFCYTTTTTTNNNNANTTMNDPSNTKIPKQQQSLLTSLSRRPGRSPLSIPIDQTVTAYDSIVSLIQKQQQKHDDDNQHQDNPILLHSQFLTNHHHHHRKSTSNTWGLISCQKDNHAPSSVRTEEPNDNLEFSVSSRLQQQPITSQKILELLSSTTITPPSTDSGSFISHARRPKRVAWIQFGGSSSSSSGGRGAPMARETYQCRIQRRRIQRPPFRTKKNNHQHPNNNNNNDDESSLSGWEYTRYDEAPIWYAGPRASQRWICQWKLSARKCWRSEIDSIVPVAAQWANAIHFFGKHDEKDPNNHHSPWMVLWNRRRHPRDTTTTTTTSIVNHKNINNNHQKENRIDTNMENAFQYYADALHPAMMASFDRGAHLDKNEDEEQQRQRDGLSSSIEYREYYHDLAVRRTLTQLLLYPTQLDMPPPRNPFRQVGNFPPPPVVGGTTIRMKPLSSFSSSSSKSVSLSILHSVQSAVHATWVWVDRIRAASTISIGGGR